MRQADTKSWIKYFLFKDQLSIQTLIELTSDCDLASAGLIDCLFQFPKLEPWINRVISYLLQERQNAIPYVKKIYLDSFVNIPSVKYIPKSDTYGPNNFSYAQMPDIPIYFISRTEELSVLNWEESEIVSLDSEWKLELGKFKTSKISILQIGKPDVVYIIDLIALHTSPELDSKLFQLFSNPKIMKIGVGFDYDMVKLKDCYKDMTCFKEILYNYLDLIILHKKIYDKDPGGLANLSEIHLKTPLCKFEQKSNWELRPLRNAQLHYAALDVYICLAIYDKYREQNVFFKAYSFDIGILSDKDSKKYATYPSCEVCKSKIHNTDECFIKFKCRICGVIGHLENECTCFIE